MAVRKCRSGGESERDAISDQQGGVIHSVVVRKSGIIHSVSTERVNRGLVVLV